MTRAQFEHPGFTALQRQTRRRESAEPTFADRAPACEYGCEKAHAHAPTCPHGGATFTRVQYCIFDSREDALAAGWPAAEYGNWQDDPAVPKTRPGWIALTLDPRGD